MKVVETGEGSGMAGITPQLHSTYSDARLEASGLECMIISPKYRIETIAHWYVSTRTPETARIVFPDRKVRGALSVAVALTTPLG